MQNLNEINLMLFVGFIKKYISYNEFLKVAVIIDKILITDFYKFLITFIILVFLILVLITIVPSGAYRENTGKYALKASTCDIMDNLEKVKLVYNFIDIYNKEYLAPFIACQKGCYYCCTDEVPVTELEFAYIIIMSGVRKIETKGIECPFLSKGQCSIYKFRPIFVEYMLF